MALPDDKRRQLDAIVQRMTADGQSPDSIRMVVSDFKTKHEAPTSTPERTWGDTLSDALPLAGGVVGGVVGAAGGIPGIMAGSAIGGGFGEAARQRLQMAQGARGTDYDFGDIATTGAMEGATAGAFGLAGKGAARIIRGVQRANITPTDVVKGIVKNLPGSSYVKNIGREAGERRAAQAFAEVDAPLNRAAARQNIFNVSSERNVALRADELDDVLTRLRQTDAPLRIGGSGSPLRAGKNPVVNTERTGDLISTQPDKWGTTSLHTADRLDDALRPSQGQLRTSSRASDFMMAKRAARLPDAAPAHTPAPRGVPTGSKLPSGPKARALSEGEERGIQELDQLLDAIHGADRGNPGMGYLRTPEAPAPPRQMLVDALTSAQPDAGTLTKAGRSMMTPEDIELFERTLGRRTPPALEYPDAWKPFMRR